MDASNSNVTVEVDNTTGQRLEILYASHSLGLIPAGGHRSFVVPPTKLKLGNFGGVTPDGSHVRLTGSIVRTGDKVHVYLRTSSRPI